MAAELFELPILKHWTCAQVKLLEHSSLRETPVQPQLYARTTSRATFNDLLRIQIVCLRRTLRALLVKWLQNAEEGLSHAFGHPTVVIDKHRPIFSSVSGTQ